MTENIPVIDTRINTLFGSFTPFTPKLEDINIQDIARSLAATCRWRGHTHGVYTVAEHSLRVMEMCSPENKLYGLLHDAGEAYLADIPAPLKAHLLFRFPDPEGRGWSTSLSFADVEQGILNAVLQHAGVEPGPMPKDVHDADMLQRKWERETLQGHHPSEFTPMSSEVAMEKWLSMYHALKPAFQEGLCPQCHGFGVELTVYEGKVPCSKCGKVIPRTTAGDEAHTELDDIRRTLHVPWNGTLVSLRVEQLLNERNSGIAELAEIKELLGLASREKAWGGVAGLAMEHKTLKENMKLQEERIDELIKQNADLQRLLDAPRVA